MYELANSLEWRAPLLEAGIEVLPIATTFSEGTQLQQQEDSLDLQTCLSLRIRAYRYRNIDPYWDALRDSAVREKLDLDLLNEIRALVQQYLLDRANVKVMVLLVVDDVTEPCKCKRVRSCDLLCKNCSHLLSRVRKLAHC